VSDTSTIAAPAPTGVFTRDQVEILSTRKVEETWLRDARLAAHGAFAAAPMPGRAEEDWRYTFSRLGQTLKGFEGLSFADERSPVAGVSGLPAPMAARIAEGGEAVGRLAQVDSSVVLRELPDELASQGVIFTSLEAAARDHAGLVQRYLGTAVTAREGKFAAMNAAYWTGGVFLYVPRNVRVEAPVRAWRWISEKGTAVFGRTLVVAEEGAEVAFVDEYGSEQAAGALSVNATEVFAGEGAKVVYTAVQRWGEGVTHLATDRLVAGRDARITMLYASLGGELTRLDARCAMQAPGSHVDMLGIYIGQGRQHIDHETLQDHQAPHASSNLLFKGALDDEARSVFRGLIRVHPKAQRTDAYQTNRNLVLSAKARADSLPNLEIQADDVRCSHAATVGQLDEEEIFYLLSRGVPKAEAVRLVVFGFFAEVLDQLPMDGVREELLRVVERKLARKA
jgi:Fe-S cluster assembly protein SufD